jgi:hypothetical protein
MAFFVLFRAAFCHPSGRGADELSEVSDSELELSELVQQSKCGKAVRPAEASAKAADVEVVVKEEAHVLARPSIKFTAQSSYQHGESFILSSSFLFGKNVFR